MNRNAKAKRYLNFLFIAATIFNFDLAFGEQSVASGSQLRDPTRPLGTVINQAGASKKEASITLNAIFNKDSSSSAIINGQLVRVGDQFAGMRVAKIYKDRVVLLNNNDQLVLTMYPSIVKESKKTSELHSRRSFNSIDLEAH